MELDEGRIPKPLRLFVSDGDVSDWVVAWRADCCWCCCSVVCSARMNGQCQWKVWCTVRCCYWTRNLLFPVVHWFVFLLC